MPTVDPHLASFGISDRRVLTGKSTPVVPVRASRAIRVWSAILAGYGGRSKAGLAALPARVGRCPGGGDGMIVASSPDLHGPFRGLFADRGEGEGRLWRPWCWRWLPFSESFGFASERCSVADDSWDALGQAQLPERMSAAAHDAREAADGRPDPCDRWRRA